MSHPATAASIKGIKKGQSRRDEPRGGTKIRALYDLLRANEGCWITVDGRDEMCRVEYLQSSYGLDVRTRRTPGGWGSGTTDLLLAGEWFGRVYVDFIAGRVG